MTTEPDRDALAAIPARYAQPAADTLAYLPKGGAQLAYMGHGEVTLALLEVDPLWDWTPLAIDEATGEPKYSHKGKRFVMWGYLTVHGKARLCVGTCDDNKGDPEKELLGDALRNGAMRFGIGTKLWSKATSADPAGRADHSSSPRRPQGTQRPASEPESAPHPATEPAERPISDKSLALFDRVKATKGTTTADTLKEFAADCGLPLTARAFDGDQMYAEQIALILDAAA